MNCGVVEGMVNDKDGVVGGGDGTPTLAIGVGEGICLEMDWSST